MIIDIIIPTYNAPDLLRHCLTGIERNTHIPHRLYIADDNSTDPSMRNIFKNLTVIKNKSGVQGFPHNCNYAVGQTEGDFVCLLNSDTVPYRHWLTAMAQEMIFDDVGIVGAKLIYPDSDKRYGGMIQHAGVARANGGVPYHIFMGQSPKAQCVNVRREINAVTFACALIRRKLWDQLGGLDEAFVGGQFEDVDFNWRARELGWKVIYTPGAQLIHHEHGSGNEFVSRHSAKNFSILKAKWGHLKADADLFGVGQ